MARIHLFMCSFLIPSVLSTTTMTVQTVAPSPSMSTTVIAASSTPTLKTANSLVYTGVAVQTDSSTSALVVVLGTTQTAPTSSLNVILSTSVVPGASTKRKFQARMTVNETYKSDFRNTSSGAFKTFAGKFEKEVGEFLTKKLSGFERVEVTNLANGSVVVDFNIVVRKSSNATVYVIVQVLKAGNGSELGYTILGNVSVNEIDQPSTSSIPSPTATETPSSTTPVAPTSSTKATEIWDKAIDLATPLGTFIIVVVAVALLVILLIALICVCCKYAKLKKKTRFPEHMAINDSEWIRSSDDLLMWERNLRASEVKTTNGVSSRPVNERRTGN